MAAIPRTSKLTPAQIPRTVTGGLPYVRCTSFRRKEKRHHNNVAHVENKANRQTKPSQQVSRKGPGGCQKVGNNLHAFALTPTLANKREPGAEGRPNAANIFNFLLYICNLWERAFGHIQIRQPQSIVMLTFLHICTYMRIWYVYSPDPVRGCGGADFVCPQRLC